MKRLRLQYKLLLTMTAVSLVPVTVLGVYGFRRISHSLEDAAIRETQDRLSRAADQLQDGLSAATTDLFFLSHLDDLKRLVDRPVGDDSAEARREKSRLAATFATFARAKGIYHQIRCIDEGGREVVRVNFREGTATVVPDELLQDKKDRDYFIETMRLRRGQLYISPLDLNREHGQVERPLRPAIRYATPLFNSRGERRGMVVTNLDAGLFLGEACATLGSQLGPCFATDERGYYTLHTGGPRAWGAPGDLGTGENLLRDFPERGEMLLAGGADQIPVPEGILFCTRVKPFPQYSNRRWLLGKTYSRSVVLGSLRLFYVGFGGLLAVTLLGAVALALILARRVTAPVTALESGAARIGAGELDHRIPVTSRDEIGSLAVSFNAMAARLKTYIRDLEETTAARERAESDLRIARDIQARILPQAVPALSDIDLNACYHPARVVGGDFYNYFLVDAHRLALVLGDVSGKGMPAALIMMVAQTLIENFAREGDAPAAVLERTNRALVAETQEDMFVTVLIGLYDLRSGRLLWANAGHPSPLLMAADGDVRPLDGSDLVLGVAEPDEFHAEDRSVVLQPGDRVVLYTDGVTEATDPDGRYFDVERLIACLRDHADADLGRLTHSVCERVLAFQAGRQPADDITLLALRVGHLMQDDSAGAA